MTNTYKLKKKTILAATVMLLVAILTAGMAAGTATTATAQSTCTGTPSISSLSVSPSTIQPGQSATLSWGMVYGAEAVVLRTPSQATGVATPGQMTVHPDQTTTYTLQAACGRNRTQTQVTLYVQVPPCSGTPSIASFTAEPMIIQPGQTSTLSWGLAANAEAAVLQTPEGKVGVGTPGQQVVQPSQTTTYVLAAFCGNQVAKRYITVAVQGAHDCSGTPTIASFTASPSVIQKGGTSTLQWGAVTNASGAYLLGPEGIVGVGTPGQLSVQPVLKGPAVLENLSKGERKMCCFLSSLWLLGPRFAFLIYWLIPYGRLKVTAAFGGSWFWALLGLIFVPWTTLMFTLVYPIIGLDWLWLGLAVLADISAYAAGAARRRDASFYRGP
jgi:hypothetical protein